MFWMPPKNSTFPFGQATLLKKDLQNFPFSHPQFEEITAPYKPPNLLTTFRIYTNHS